MSPMAEDGRRARDVGGGEMPFLGLRDVWQGYLDFSVPFQRRPEGPCRPLFARKRRAEIGREAVFRDGSGPLSDLVWVPQRSAGPVYRKHRRPAPGAVNGPPVRPRPVWGHNGPYDPEGGSKALLCSLLSGHQAQEAISDAETTSSIG